MNKLYVVINDYSGDGLDCDIEAIFTSKSKALNCLSLFPHMRIEEHDLNPVYPKSKDGRIWQASIFLSGDTPKAFEIGTLKYNDLKSFTPQLVLHKNEGDEDMHYSGKGKISMLVQCSLEKEALDMIKKVRMQLLGINY